MYSSVDSVERSSLTCVRPSVPHAILNALHHECEFLSTSSTSSEECPTLCKQQKVTSECDKVSAIKVNAINPLLVNKTTVGLFMSTTRN